MPGHIPAMTTPSRKRSSLTDQAARTAAKHMPIRPTAKTMRAIQTRGLSLLMTRLDGQSKMTYET